MHIRVCALGDVVGRSGRRCLDQQLPRLRKEFAPDLIICNGENAAGGFGLTEKICRQFLEQFGIDVITTGNHWHDKPEILRYHKQYDNLLLPANMYNVPAPVYGHCLRKSSGGATVGVINLTGRVFMKGENSCPFKAFDEIFPVLAARTKMIIVDLHAEATSEKQALAHYVTGRASLVYGTHTHCPTGDERILGGHTAFQTDLGMTGAYDSVIGMSVETSLPAFLDRPRKRFEPAKKDPWMCGVLADLDPATGQAVSIYRLRWPLENS